MRIKKPFLLVALSTLVVVIFVFAKKDVATVFDDSIQGFSFTGASYKMAPTEIDEVVKSGANWVCFMPYAYVDKANELRDTFAGQWWGETQTGIRQSVRWSKQRGLKVCVKPHLWFLNGMFNGDFKLSNTIQWRQFEERYRAYVLKFAVLAQHEKVDLFCLGVELKNFVKNRPQFWFDLIAEVRKVYTGKITYAANWDNYEKIPFWHELDLIGLDAYFSFSPNKEPTVQELKLAMREKAAVLKKFASAHKKQIAFTEYGFRSEEFCCNKPWDYKEHKAANNNCQLNAYLAFNQTFYNEAWFAGGFIWKWFATGHLKEEGLNGYSPQGKPALKAISSYFKND